jgi:hypothetical protein
MWKYIVIISLIFCASSVRAQKPVIDSMIVNEDSSQLTLYGSFGITPGFITVSGHTLTILQWSDTTLIASIPDTGIGSAGSVIVKSMGQISDTSVLSVVTGIYTLSEGFWEIGEMDNYGYEFHFSFRVDFQTLQHSGDAIISSKTSWIRAFRSDMIMRPTPNVYQENDRTDTTIFAANVHRTGFECAFYRIDKWGLQWAFQLSDLPVIPDYIVLQFYPTNGNPSGISYDTTWFPLDGTSGYFDLDSLFEVPAEGQTGTPPIDYYGNYTYTAQSGTTLFPPPALFIELQYSPILIAPQFDSTNWQPHLTWLSMQFIDSFEVEIAPDSSFNNSVDEFKVLDTSFVPPNLETGVKYYWRVRGKNSDGNTPWSSVWSFGENPSSVKLATNDIVPVLQVTGISIEYKTAESATLTIYNVLGEVVYRSSSEGNDVSQSIPISSLTLRGGNYFIVLRSAENVLSDRFSLLQ